VKAVVETVKALEWMGYPIIICTGRPEEYREQTSMWLFKHGVRHEALYMRPTGDFRPDHDVKLDVLKQLRRGGAKVLCVFEDRSSVVRMWREQGVPCFQVRDGDY
jgi:hypothetical protein